jgi:putative transposase
MQKIKRAYKYRFYPTEEQKLQLAHTFGCARFVYNRFLKIRSETYAKTKKKMGYRETSALLTQLKKQEDFGWLKDAPCVPLQQSLRNLDKAFKNFFAKRTRYPNFKKKNSHQSAHYVGTSFSFSNGILKITKNHAPLAIRWSRKFTSRPSSITISKDFAERYFVSFSVEEGVCCFPRIENFIGVDVGIKDICVTSDGFKSGAPKYTRKYAEKLAKKQRVLARKLKGSKNRAKARLAVAKIYAKISDSRNDFNNKLTTMLIRENQAIAIESLNVKGMIKNHSLAASIIDSAWNDFFRKLKYKSAWYGRDIFEIDRWSPTSKTCSCCGYINKELTLSDRCWECISCKSILDRDINAAKNILTVGLTGIAFGENVRLSC